MIKMCFKITRAAVIFLSMNLSHNSHNFVVEISNPRVKKFKTAFVVNCGSGAVNEGSFPVVL